MNRQAFPIGEEALQLGGAYTGYARDASAGYYNPGGLVFGRAGSVGLSLSVNLRDAYDVAGGSTDASALEYSDAFGVPLYAGGAVTIGGDETGEGRHALAATTLSPSQGGRNFTLAEQIGPLTRYQRVERRDYTRWYGASYAYRPLEWLGVGLTAFVATRSFEHREATVAADAGVRASASEVSLSAELLLFRIGALVRPIPQLTVGLMFQPPAIVVGARANARATRADGTTTLFANEDLQASSPLPFQIRLGAAWQPERSLLLSGDLILEGPQGSESDPVRRVVFAGPRGLLGTYLETEWWSDVTFDVALGGRAVIEDVVPVSVSFFTSVSAAPTPLAGDAYRPDQVDLFGATLSVGFIREGVQFSIGLLGSLGFGSGLRAGPFDSTGPPSYTVADVSTQTLYLFLSGAGAAVDAIAETVAETLDTDVQDGREDEED